MTFLDEKIAKIQKQELIKKKKALLVNDEINNKIDIDELTQEEIMAAIKNGHLLYKDYDLNFEITKCFDDMIVFPLPKDFFYKYNKSLNKYEWYNAENFSVIVGKITLHNKKAKTMDISEFFEIISRKTKLFIENTSLNKEDFNNYSKYIIESRMASSVSFIYIYSVIINIENNYFYFMFICLEKNKNIWKNIIVAISNLIEVCEGDK